MDLADNLRRLRQQKQWSQPRLADEAHISKGYINMLESGEMTNPSLDVLLKIADALGTTIAELVSQPRVAATEDAPKIPDTLMQFAKIKRKKGEPLSEQDIVSLAKTQYRGKRPATVEDWAYVFEFLKRTLGGKER